MTPSRLIEGKVTAIVDGDTFHLDTDEGRYVVDLAGIDAPEKGQAAGDMAAQVLHLKVLDRQVKVLVVPTPNVNPVVRRVTPVPGEASKGDDPGRQDVSRQRVCGIVYRGGCVNSQLVAEGLAWHDPRACPSGTLAKAQEGARVRRQGLWEDSRDPVPPWEWRARRETVVSGTGTSNLTDTEVEDLSRYFEAQTPPAIVEAAARVTPAEVPAVAGGAPVAPVAGGYWLTTGSGIRHNRDCRYFGKSKGRPCGANEGRPCQKCGG